MSFFISLISPAYIWQCSTKLQEYKACPACGHYSTKLHIDSNCSTCAITKAALPETQTRVLSAILASIAMHIMTATAARSKSKAAGASEAQQLLPWREWAVYVLTEVRLYSSCGRTFWDDVLHTPVIHRQTPGPGHHTCRLCCYATMQAC